MAAVGGWQRLRVYKAGCPWSVWPVEGSLEAGTLILSAISPYSEEPTCAWYFTYYGEVERGGCNNASGGWYNSDGGSGSFWMSKACEIRPYETTTGGVWFLPRVRHDAVVSNTSGGDLSGRKYRESNYATGYDACWYPGSPIPKFDSVTNPNPFYLASDNAYKDTIGWGPTSITHYRNHGDAPCETHLYQQMQIACGTDGYESYHGVQNNVLIAEIGTSTVTVSRDGVAYTTGY